MGRYSAVANQRGPNAPKEPHPIWNSLGCLMIVVVIAMSIALAYATVEYALDNRWPIPPVLLAPIFLPGWMFSYMPGLASILQRAFNVDFLMAYAATAIVYIVVLGGLISILYAFIYRLVGPPKYGPLDSPPTRRGSRNYRR